jgi:hypothetical protein
MMIYMVKEIEEGHKRNFILKGIIEIHFGNMEAL